MLYLRVDELIEIFSNLNKKLLDQNDYIFKFNSILTIPKFLNENNKFK